MKAHGRNGVRWFKTRSKKILKALKLGDETSIALAEKLELDLSKHVSLMTVQHAVAVDAGFSCWADLIKASEDQLQSFIKERNGRWL